MGKRKRPEPIESSEGGWMATYGDLVTLLLTFFVLLYSFSSIDAAKWEALVKSFSGANGVMDSVGPGGYRTEQSMPIEPTTIRIRPEHTTESATQATSAETTPVETTVAETTVTTVQPTPTPKPTPKPTTTPTSYAASEKLYQELNNFLAGTSLKGQLQVSQQKSKVTLRLIASVIFESGSDRLKPEADAILQGASEIVNKHLDTIKEMKTEGHTDNVTPPEGDIESKWELAARRAAHVLQYLAVHSGINQNIIYTVGYGSTRPIASDDTVEGQEQNNRVDIVITTKTS